MIVLAAVDAVLPTSVVELIRWLSVDCGITGCSKTRPRTSTSPGRAVFLHRPNHGGPADFSRPLKGPGDQDALL